MPLEQLRQITTETKKRCGYVTYHEIFVTMGYTRINANNYRQN